MADALRGWSEQLAGWAIPEHILAAAPESPWVLPHAMFLRRVDRQLRDPSGASHAAILDALAGGGSVLDVGAGAGASSLPVARAITHVTAVDTNVALLAEFAKRAIVPYRLVEGRWPDVAGEIEAADVVVCGHVLYNVPDLAPFIGALTGHARRRVVVEVAEAHPLTKLNPLWQRFHGIERPTGPTADDAIAALSELGIEPAVTRWRKPATGEHDMVDVTRRRLCLPPERSTEVAEALRETGVDDYRNVVTLTWAGQRAFSM